MLKKYFRLKRIRSLRTRIEEIMKTDNKGRAEELLFRLPEIKRTTTRSGGFGRATAEAQLRDGHEFTEYDDSLLAAIKKVTLTVYLHLIKIGDI